MTYVPSSSPIAHLQLLPVPATAPPAESQSQSASALLKQSRTAPRFHTHSDLDALFGSADHEHGLPQGHILGLVGPPGSGKSVVGASIALEAASNGIQVLVIDTADGLFAPRELAHMARHRFGPGAASFSSSQIRDNPELLADSTSLLHNVYRMRVVGQEQLLGLIYGGLRAWLRDHPQVKLVLFDSLSVHLRTAAFVDSEQVSIGRYTESKAEQRSHALSDLQDLLSKLTTGFDPVTVIWTSQMSTSIPKDSGHASLVSQLPSTWFTPKTYTVLLRQGLGPGGAMERSAWLTSSPYRDHVHTEVTFDISTGGVVSNVPPEADERRRITNDGSV